MRGRLALAAVFVVIIVGCQTKGPDSRSDAGGTASSGARPSALRRGPVWTEVAQSFTTVRLFYDSRLLPPTLPAALNVPPADLNDFVRKGEQEWWRGSPLDGIPFGIPTAVYDSPLRKAISALADVTASIGLPARGPDGLPLGMSRSTKSGRISMNCSGCHSALIYGEMYAGAGNKRLSQGGLFEAGRALLALGTLVSVGDGALAQAVREETQRLNHYEMIFGHGCGQQFRGTLSSLRIWEMSSRLLPAGAAAESALAADKDGSRYPCGLTKAPNLFGMAYKNLHFHDGAVNSAWVADFPVYDFAGFAAPEWFANFQNTEAQRQMKAYVQWGMRTPTFDDVFNRKACKDRHGTACHAPKVESQDGYDIFHGKRGPARCSSCHGEYSTKGVLEEFYSRVVPLAKVGTHAERADSVGLAQIKNFSNEDAGVTVPQSDARLAEDYPRGYRPLPLCGWFANYPYLHTGAVPNIDELLKDSSQRNTNFFVTDSPDPAVVGFSTAAPARQSSLASGHSGEEFGTTLAPTDREALVAFMKSISCPPHRVDALGLVGAGASESSDSARPVPGLPDAEKRVAVVLKATPEQRGNAWRVVVEGREVAAFSSGVSGCDRLAAEVTACLLPYSGDAAKALTAQSSQLINQARVRGPSTLVQACEANRQTLRDLCTR